MAIINQIGGISTGGLTGVLKGPLEKLFGTKPGAGMYQYPADLGNDPSRTHIVQFHFSEIIPGKFDVTPLYDAGTAAVSAGGAALTGDFSGITNAIPTAGEASATAVKTAELAQNISAYLKPQKKETRTVVSLYMPDTLAMNYHAEYSDLTLTEATNNMNRIAGAVGSLVEDLVKGGMNKENIKNAIIKNVNEYGPEAGLRLVDKQFNTNITELGLKALGKAINPQLQLLYKGVGFRTFTMEFLFTPKSKDESDQVSAIVNTFIYASSPKVQGKGGMYFTPPSIVNVSFKMAKTGSLSGITDLIQKAGNSIIPGVPLGSVLTGNNGVGTGVENDRLFKVGDCVLEDVSVDYAPNGWAAYGNGAPIQTRLNLSFKEIDIIDRGRMEKGEVR